MPTAFALALTQLAERRVLLLLLKCLAATLVAFAVLAVAGWYALGALAGALLPGLDEGLRQLAAIVLWVLGAVLLWRVVALAVLQLFANEVVEAVEARHYPQALAQACPLSWREELSSGLRSAGRALLANLIALPLALALLVTGLGTALVFWAANAVVLGRELQDMAWLRHRHAEDAPAPLGRGERLVLGGIVSGLLFVPFINFLAPFIGAAMATHLIHRKGTRPDAR